jgi:hypothetical protein
MVDAEKINKNISGWLGVGCTLIPVIKIVASLLGFGHFTELIDQVVNVTCVSTGAVGTYLLAKSEPLKRK